MLLSLLALIFIAFGTNRDVSTDRYWLLGYSDWCETIRLCQKKKAATRIVTTQNINSHHSTNYHRVVTFDDRLQNSGKLICINSPTVINPNVTRRACFKLLEALAINGKTARSQSFHYIEVIESSQQPHSPSVNGPRFLSAGPLIMGDNRGFAARRARMHLHGRRWVRTRR
jgi:hypothetical protein